jgi:hypothetical protein
MTTTGRRLLPKPRIGGIEMDVLKPTFAAYSIIGSGDSSVI